MKCPECVGTGRRSTLAYVENQPRATGTDIWQEPFTDELGHRHHHVFSTRTDYYKCSNGHRVDVTVSKSDSCPTDECPLNEPSRQKMRAKHPERANE